MDVNVDQQIADILDSLPPKTPRSRLEPYRELIREMRRRGRTYREIAQVLGERCGVQIAASSVHEFVRRRARAKPVPSMEAATPVLPTAPVPQKQVEPASTDEMRQRIQAIKERPAPAAREAKPVFRYNENEPLRVKKANER